MDSFSENRDLDYIHDNQLMNKRGSHAGQSTVTTFMDANRSKPALRAYHSCPAGVPASQSGQFDQYHTPASLLYQELDFGPRMISGQPSLEKPRKSRRGWCTLLCLILFALCIVGVTAVVVYLILDAERDIPPFAALIKGPLGFACIKASMQLKILNRSFKPGMSNPKSPEFLSLAESFSEEVNILFLHSNHHTLYYGATVTNMSSGSIQTIAELLFSENVGIIDSSQIRDVFINNLNEVEYKGKKGLVMGDFIVCSECILVNVAKTYLTQRPTGLTREDFPIRPSSQTPQQKTTSTTTSEPAVPTASVTTESTSATTTTSTTPNKTQDNTTTTIIPVLCPQLSVLPHGYVYPLSCTEGMSKEGTECFAMCQSYTVLQSSDRRVCNETGHWNPPEPFKCGDTFCPKLSYPYNGHLRDYWCASEVSIPGTVCRYSCDEGYILHGPEHRMCTEAGAWDSEEEALCLKPTTTVSSTLTTIGTTTDTSTEDHAIVNTIAITSAEPGTTKTTSDTTITDKTTTETKITEAITTTTTTTTLTTTITDTYQSVPQNLTFEHRPSWPIKTITGGSTVELAASNTTDYVIPSALQSPSTPESPPASTTPATSSSTTLSDSVSSTPLQPTCVSLRSPEHGFVFPLTCTQGSVYGANCFFSCEPGYQVLGETSFTCNENGIWTPQSSLPTCSKIVCPPVQQPRFGLVIPPSCTMTGQSPGTVCSTSCMTGYRLQGPQQRTCYPDGIWDATADTQCLASRCPALSSPSMGEMMPVECTISEQLPGTQCSVLCHSGYTLIGPYIHECRFDGSWDSHDQSACIDKVQPATDPTVPATGCYPVFVPTYGFVNPPQCSSEVQIPGERCTFSCEMGYLLEGPKFRECTAFNNWDTNQVTLCTDPFLSYSTNPTPWTTVSEIATTITPNLSPENATSPVTDTMTLPATGHDASTLQSNIFMPDVYASVGQEHVSVRCSGQTSTWETISISKDHRDTIIVLYRNGSYDILSDRAKDRIAADVYATKTGVDLGFIISQVKCEDQGSYQCHVQASDGGYFTESSLYTNLPRTPVITLPVELIANRETKEPIRCEGNVGSPHGIMFLQFKTVSISNFITLPATVRYFNGTGSCYSTAVAELHGYIPTLDADGSVIRCLMINDQVMLGQHEKYSTATLTILPESICEGTENGAIQHPDACSKFINCTNFVPSVGECPDALCFDPVSQRCGQIALSMTVSNGSLNDGLTAIKCRLLHLGNWHRLTIQRQTTSGDKYDVIRVQPNGSASWSAKDLESRALKEVFISRYETKLSIWISVLKCSDEGLYVCQASGEFPLKEEQSRLNIISKPEEPVLRVPVQVLQNDTTQHKVTCTAEVGYPEGSLVLMSTTVDDTGNRTTREIEFDELTQERSACRTKVEGKYIVDGHTPNGTVYSCKVRSNLTDSKTVQHPFYLIPANYCESRNNESLDHPFNCRHYIMCTDGGTYVSECIAGFCFNPETKQCDVQDPTDTRDASTRPCFPNRHGEYLPHPFICNKFYWCVEGREEIQHCQHGTVYHGDGQCTYDVEKSLCFRNQETSSAMP